MYLEPFFCALSKFRGFIAIELKKNARKGYILDFGEGDFSIAGWSLGARRV